MYLSNNEHKYFIRGTLLYMAPEILVKHKYDASVDLWSVGVIMFESLFGRTPYPNCSYAELVEMIARRHPIEIPKIPRVSDECKDLLQSLLKYDPELRITFEDFFSHPFVDLDCTPTKENYEKAENLLQEAVKMDAEKKPIEAFFLYCRATRNLISLLGNEYDPKKKEVVRLRINKCLNRIEKLKTEFQSSENDAGKEQVPQQVEERGNVSVSRGAQSLNRRSGFTFQELRALSKSTPAIADALEIGEVAEQYLVENNYVLALEKFMSCLRVLVPLLEKEPLGRRRDLLMNQVKLWMQMAVNTKDILATKTVQPEQGNNEQCVIQ